MANTKRRSPMNLVASMIAMLAPASISCAGDDEVPKSEYSELCSDTTQCADLLTCFAKQGICSQSCETTQECQLNLGVSTSVCIGGVCLEPCTATDLGLCGRGLRCVQGLGGGACEADR